MFIVRIKTYLNRRIELSDTKETYDNPRDLIEREHFMDVYPKDLAVIIKEKVLCGQASVGKEADLYVLPRKRNLCDQPHRSTKASARPVMDSARLRETQNKVTGSQHAAGELKTRTIN
ncbi:hypothetical protein PoB_005529400 [Plakobranchus ocellatus]|uniref:Uncharacterized protein n=1 Tax=Plakobranchus ocellatus TaxID=259542 RepID=A0AAV4C8A4_9GAST|nr:hypothetical protein PoB_005529400 [Plakobranchus ocellatus]